jgi:hypothetical protein
MKYMRDFATVKAAINAENIDQARALSDQDRLAILRDFESSDEAYIRRKSSCTDFNEEITTKSSRKQLSK